jgi:amidase
MRKSSRIGQGGTDFGLSRRAFLGAGAAGGAALLAGGWSSLLRAAPAALPAYGEGAAWFEASISQLQSMMAAGGLSSRELTQAYLRRIGDLNPIVGAVIQTNPNAMAIAAQLDNERRAGRLRGPLHGIPVLLKDNVATADTMQTTAGSLALVNSRVPGDAPLVDRLRKAGAVILGKANLSEWANFRGFTPVDETGSFFLNGWSARGGFTRNAYLLGWDPSGSSSGSAVAAASNLCAVAVGSETDGSIVSPAGNNMIVGLKPSLGLVSQSGIIPIAHSQDTAGPMGRSVADVATLLGALQSPFGDALGKPLPEDYTKFLDAGALNGARIGIDENLFFTYTDPAQAEVAWAAVETMVAAGAELVTVDVNDPLATFYDAEFTVLLCEFKDDVAAYLAKLDRTSMRTLADLIEFNYAHCPQELRYFGQEIFEIAQSTGGVADPAYADARATCLKFARDEGLEPAFATQRVDAIAIPTAGWSSSHAAVAGYPNLSVPVGFDANDRPVGLCLVGGYLQEPKVLSLGYALEQLLQARRPPSFAGMPPGWADAGICAAIDVKPRGKSDLKDMGRRLGWYKGRGPKF